MSDMHALRTPSVDHERAPQGEFDRLNLTLSEFSLTDGEIRYIRDEMVKHVMREAYGDADHEIFSLESFQTAFRKQVDNLHIPSVLLAVFELRAQADEA